MNKLNIYSHSGHLITLQNESSKMFLSTSVQKYSKMSHETDFGSLFRLKKDKDLQSASSTVKMNMREHAHAAHPEIMW